MHNAVTDESIAELVDAFYIKVRDDRLLGPVFASAIGNAWGPHLEKMNRFWSSVLLDSRVYKGNPMAIHQQLPGLTRDHFERWLQLWRATAPTICSSELASLFIRKAEMIGGNLLRAVQRISEAAIEQHDACKFAGFPGRYGQTIANNDIVS
jgi:hemoglobin